jgi:hypothetical protein
MANILSLSPSSIEDGGCHRSLELDPLRYTFLLGVLVSGQRSWSYNALLTLIQHCLLLQLVSATSASVCYLSSDLQKLWALGHMCPGTNEIWQAHSTILWQIAFHVEELLQNIFNLDQTTEDKYFERLYIHLCSLHNLLLLHILAGTILQNNACPGTK